MTAKLGSTVTSVYLWLTFSRRHFFYDQGDILEELDQATFSEYDFGGIPVEKT